MEAIDWMDKVKYGVPDDSSSLRLYREGLMYTTLVRALTPVDQSILRGAFIIKSIWRDPFPDEALYDDPSTFDPLRDTDPGYIGAVCFQQNQFSS